MHKIESDKKKNARGALISAIVIIALSLAYIGFLILILPSALDDPISLPVFLILILIYVAVIVGTLIALHQRRKEIEEGEIYDARKY
ncbi:MAG: hypothetical protein PUB87_06945 [Eubacteriaceae bacterium]|nr:hypothetical protein [Eubacteriaceae bacterium]